MMFAGFKSRWITPRRMGVVDGVADVDKPPQQLAQLQRPGPGSSSAPRLWNRSIASLRRVALDEPHRVVRAAVGIGAHAVDGDNAGVLEPAGDLGLDHEPLAAGRVVGVLLEDLLEGDLAVQLGVERHEHGPQAAPRMRPQDPEPLAVAGGRADRVSGRPVDVVIIGFAGLAVPAAGDAGKRGFDGGLAQLGQAGPRGAGRRAPRPGSFRYRRRALPCA